MDSENNIGNLYVNRNRRTQTYQQSEWPICKIRSTQLWKFYKHHLKCKMTSMTKNKENIVKHQKECKMVKEVIYG